MTTNPIPVVETEFRSANLLLAVDSIAPGRRSVRLRGVIDVAGTAGLRSGEDVTVDWPYPVGETASYRRLVFPVRKESDGSYLALSGAIDERSALRLLAGLPRYDEPPTASEVSALVDHADAAGSYTWTVTKGSDGRQVEAHLYAVYRGDPPPALQVEAPASDEPGGGWTFQDSVVYGTQEGVLILDKTASGSWRLATDAAPWLLLGSPGLPTAEAR